MNGREQLEVVLDGLFNSHPRAHSLTCQTRSLAVYADESVGIKHSPTWWGRTLQEYRVCRSHNYRVVAEGYGKSATWRIIAIKRAPAVHRLRQTIDHHLYAVQDAVKREGRDLDHEILPALEINGDSKTDLAYRINEFEVNAVQRLVAAGMHREDAITWIAPTVAKIRERWAA